ncbi:presequence protease, mitochondrial isoform X1 [Mesoplodon densirostris]|uniref:presequence protease, mitochondrial isoform X1 n=2 Tax=Mesoplodon densirostris TaxID=48708 RepID=UPI0028DD3395|nr:presequence protease, mitochondrial isoform X1 [Mesoplodon densirostris]
MWRNGWRSRMPLWRLSGRSGSLGAWRWASTMACERALLRYRVGEKIHGFTVSQVTSVPELSLTAVKLSHDSTGARHLHLAREDRNNLFSVQFRTTPVDSSGAPHVLEHTVLCGSQRYPCRDPFFKMLNRSLSTFMNAFTASDYTLYPFSTQNPKDFRNLLSVYLDAAFFPCLRELDFCQEGWRLEHEDPNDPQTPLVFKGVVFNEMKGAFTDNERMFSQHVQSRLLPDHTYSVVSGGDPLCIPDLTWEQLRQFHATHYHPSNARFFTYGNFPLEQHLKQIHEEALSKFQRIKPCTAVPAQKPWDKPREFQTTCAPASLAAGSSGQTTISISFLLPDITDTFEAFTLNLLSSLLISGPNSPFYKALIESGLGTDFSPDVGYNGCTREAYFSVGLQGIAEKDIQTVQDLVDRTLDDIIEKGFEDDRIEALLHKIEIQMKHQSVSFGLALTSYVASCWNHDGDPVELLKLGSQVARFRKCLEENPKFLQEKVKQYFKNNQHKLTLSMKPDDKYSEKQMQLETEKLKQKINSLSPEDKQQIYEKGLELQAQQSQPQDVSCLPALKVSDIEPRIPFTEVEVALAAGDTPVQYCTQPTNGVIYFRAFSSLNTLPEELRPYVPLFCNVLTKLGCGSLDYRELAQQVDLKTGGLAATPHVLPDDSHLDTYEQGVLFSSFCLDRNLPDMMHLWSEIFNNPRFEDEEHFRVLVKMTAQELSNGVPDAGHLYASIRAGRTLAPAGDLQETFGGMDQVRLMKRIAEMTDIKPILRKLPRIKKHLLNCDNFRCSVNATPQQMSQVENSVDNFLRTLSRSKKERKPVHPHVVEKSAPKGPGRHSPVTRKLVTDPTFKPCPMKTHFLLPFPVNYVAECIRTAPYTAPAHASLKILARLMTAKFLHTEIREKGGAYGGGARLSYGGIFTLYSYRDPHSTETLQSFLKAVDWAKSGRFTQQDINEAKLSVFAAVDAPVAPSDKGLDCFLYGLSDEAKQAHREQLFAVRHEDLVDVSNRYLGAGSSTHGIALLGPDNASITKDPSWIVR